MQKINPEILILYFSGTGNTAFIAGLLSQALGERGIAAESAEIEAADPQRTAAAGVLLFGFPVYGGRMPAFLTERIASLAHPAGRRLYLFATFGLYAGNALRAAAQQFGRLGFTPAGAAEFKLPGSDGLAFLSKQSKSARSAQETDFRNLPRIRENVEALAEAAAAGLHAPAPQRQQAVEEFAAGLSAYRRRSAVIDLLLRGALLGMEKTIRRRFQADDSCIRCGTCAASCPVGNIVLPPGGKPRFGERCVLCMRCLHQCPTESIQIGRATRGKFRWKGPEGGYTPPRLRSPTGPPPGEDS